MGIRFLTTTFAFIFLGVASLFAREESLLARITVYWPGEGQIRACSNGARLRAGHCAVDPKRIPYGSRVVFPDAECVAVDSGPGVVKRTAARACGRTAGQREAIVIDRFFESKEAALSWSNDHPQFMTVRVVQPGLHDEKKDTVAELDNSERATKTAPKQNAPSALPKFDSNKLQLGLPLNSVLGAAQERT
jgi:3D (Asp-Asp-Asp) domain-containing protein